MHSKYHRRLSHAARAPRIWNRQVSDNTTPTNSGNGGDDISNEVPAGGFTLTGPITLTFISTIQSTQSRTSAISASSSTSSTFSTAEQTSISTSAASTEESASQTPSDTAISSTPFPSVIFPSAKPSGSSSGSNSSTQMESGALSSTKLTSGSIAGIVIGCLLVLGALIFYLIRARAQRSRMKLRGVWNRSKVLDSSLGISSSSYEPKPYMGDAVPPNMSPVMRFAPASQQAVLPAITTIVAPAITYNNPEALTPLSAQSTYGSPYGGFSSPSANPVNLAPFTATVISTFITTLPDELSIKVAETVRILAEYDDGWALCMNGNGEQGMVPVECLNRGTSANGPSGLGGLAVPSQDRDARGSRRVSSLDPAAQALKVYRN